MSVQRLRLRARIADTIDAMLAQLPLGDPERASIQKRAGAYSTDCGCAMGAVFLTITLVLAPVYVVITGDLRARTLFLGLLSIFIASMAGKVVGLVLASVRLVLLRWQLTRRLQQGGRDGVYVH